ncbi:Tetratricopeptide-like helical [Penicillium argentinense]|uniref:Tetratricopeptide-like helical n=1 Tax=Penicillium argentinense TaxID=1131581 RepID=A0A9W9G5H2_9EURO|nr:Tetratricopeptide-like helical [Penicillium argentinense]KAJ5112524.1 Tetratricopeptide-like helical [Penicillium argentinense]
MAIPPTNSTDDKLSSLWHAACTDYANETGTMLGDEELRGLRGPEDLSRQLEFEKDNFEDFRMKRRPLLHAMQTVLAPFENWGDLIAGAVAAAFPPASSIMGAMLLVVRGARRVSESFDMVTDLFRNLGHFALRLDSYKGVPLSEGMKVIIVKVLVNLLRVCAASQKLLRKGSLKARLTKWAKNVIAEDTEVSSLLAELEELTSQENMMVSAHGLKLTHQALRNTEELLERDDRRHDREKLEKVKAALQPVSGSSQVFSFINENRIPGSGIWIEDMLRTWWQGNQPLLWLHGGPGVGKSHLASKIITGFASGEFSGTAPLVASFFCRNNDVDLRSINKALRTLAWQVATQSPSFATHVEEFCLKEDAENTYTLWGKLLLKHLANAPSAETCFVIDGLDEAELEELEVLGSLLEKAFSEDDSKTRPSLRIVLLSRESVRPMLEEHSLDWIPDIEIGNNENKDDLHEYVSQKLQKTRLFRAAPHLQEEIVQEISREAEGLWEWANLVIKAVLRCRTKEQIQKTVRSTPRGISAMLSQELQRLSRELSLPDEMSYGEYSIEEAATQIDQLNVLLSFVTLAQKPLNVQQLNTMLHIIFKEEVLNLEDDIRSLYSSLFQIRHTTDEYGFEQDFVILRHSSFYEYFRTSQESGSIHVNVEQTEANFVYVILQTFREVHKPESDIGPEDIYLGDLRPYAEKFLPSHLVRANPEMAGKRREDISALFEDLFVQEKHMNWLVEVIQMRDYAKYCFYPSSRVSDTGKFWLNAEDRVTANRRAELVLSWLLPETKQRFEDNARLSEEANDTCLFTVLFSFMVRTWFRLWLAPDKINEEDGWPAALPRLLKVYYAMAAVDKGLGEDDETRKLLGMTWGNTDVSVIMEAAELQKFEHAAMWHARVAQALLLQYHHREAREQFHVTLGLDKKANTLDHQELSVVHRDLARACTEIGRHAEALNHMELAEMMRMPRDDYGSDKDRVGRLLNTAQLKYRAKQRDNAIAIANEAWQELLATKEDWWYPDFLSFFDIFLELQTPQHLGTVLDCAAEHFEGASSKRPKDMNFADYIFEVFTERPHTMYRVFQYALKEKDQDRLAHLARTMERIDTLPGERHNIANLKYLIATVLFDKGHLDLAVQGWCQVLNHANCATDSARNAENNRGRSLAHLVELCLSGTEISFCGSFPIMLDTAAESGDACLVISSWLLNHGDPNNARHALRGRVKACIALLSDDDPTNDEIAFIALLKTFLVDPGSEEDLGAALYWIKRENERLIKVYYNEERDVRKSKDGLELLDTLGEIHIENDGEDMNSTDGLDDLDIWFICDPLTRCSICMQEITSIHGWYYCRSCPYKTCCRECSGKLRWIANSSDLSKCPGICDDEHDFFYTGGLIRLSERVPEGMVPVVSSDGDRYATWIEDWKDRLAEKWETAGFAFDGGLSGWCMRVLPEPQRTRWAKMFKV